MIFKHFLLQVEMAIGEVNSFIYGCSETKEAVLIDAGKYDPAFSEFVEEHGLKLNTLFVTHDHGDHVAGVKECAEKFGATVLSGTSESSGHPTDKLLRHGDEVTVGNLTGRVVSTPGHTPVALSLIFPGMVFSGDALFAGSVGGTGTPENFKMQIDAIREHLLTLPPETEVHSGHGPATTIGIESKHNPFFV